MERRKSDAACVASRGQAPAVGIIGMGGYAGSHHRVMDRLEAAGVSRLVCTCDPFPDRFESQMREWRFDRRGVRVYDHYRKMLDAHADELDVVVVATPISLHAEMHRAAVERGISVYLEKPPTLDPAELDAMIRTDEAAPHKTQVGFNLVAGSERHRFKERLVAGEFGAIREVRLRAFRGRAESYFRRAGWAGRLRIDGRLVLDSVMGNAASHDVQTALFFAGQEDLHARGEMVEIQAELYRAHELESADTFFVKAQTKDGIRLRMALTHACLPETQLAEPDAIEIITERARLFIEPANAWRVAWNDGRLESAGGPETWTLDHNHRAYYTYLRGESETPTTPLDACRSFVHLHALTYVSSGCITSVPRFEEWKDTERVYRSVPGIEEAASRFLGEGLFPSGQKLDWARPDAARVVTPGALNDLDAVVDCMGVSE